MEPIGIPHHQDYLKAIWDGITVEYMRSNETGDYDATFPKQTIGVALAPQERVVWRVDGGSSQTTPLMPGSVFLYSSSEFIWSYREGNSECVHLTLNPHLLNRVAAESSTSKGVEIEYQVLFADPTILHIAHLFKSELLNGGLAGQLLTESLTNVLAVHLLRNYSGLMTQPKLEAGTLDGLMLKQLKDFIEENLAEDLTIARLATVAHVSPFHFAREFKAATGQAPHRYVIQQRIERAKLLLSVTRLSVSEVAYRVGFSNQSHFTAQFRKATGTTPKAYRDRF